MQPLAAGAAPAATFALECSECGATLALGPAQRTAVCPYCASPNVVERPPSRDRPAPHFALAFVLLPARATAMAKRWARGRWLAPQAFRRAPIENLRGVYLPAYLYGAAAFTQYHGA